MKLDESVIDLTQSTLPNDIWNLETKTMIPEIKEEILQKTDEAFNKVFGINTLDVIEKIHITGSIGTQNWTKETDIDVHLSPKDLKRFNEDDVKKLFKYADEENLEINNRPVELYIQLDNEQDLKSDAVYDLLNDEWIVESETLDGLTDFSYVLDEFNEILQSIDLGKAELERAIIDKEYIEEFLENLEADEKFGLSELLTSKVEEIENTIEELVDIKKEVQAGRKEAYSMPDEMFEELGFAKRSMLPGNVIFKFLQRYGYMKLLSCLQEVIEDNVVTDEELEVVKDELKM